MTMVEKVARALSIAEGYHPEACSNDEEETPMWTLFLPMARAAIEAMREPTAAMVAAMKGNGAEGPEDEVASDFSCAIDAALSEGGED